MGQFLSMKERPFSRSEVCDAARAVTSMVPLLISLWAVCRTGAQSRVDRCSGWGRGSMRSSLEAVLAARISHSVVQWAWIADRLALRCDCEIGWMRRAGFPCSAKGQVVVGVL